MDPEGRPLSGVSMIGEYFRNTWEFTPLDGPQFTVRGLSASRLPLRTLIFRHAGRGLGKAVKIDGTDRCPIEVRLEPTASATGRLLDGAGRPCDGVEVRAWPRRQ